MVPNVLSPEVYRDRKKVDELVTRNAKLLYRGRAESFELERWARDAVENLWSADLRVTTFIPTLALRDVGTRVAEAERGGRPNKRLTPV